MGPWGDQIGSDSFNWTIPDIWHKLQKDCRLDDRKHDVEQFNATSTWRKRGIAMTPVKYGMSLSDYKSMSTVSVFSDGSVLVSHSGCEIGQGIHTKVSQAAAYVLSVDLEIVKVADTETGKAPNGSSTGGSGTSECIVEATRLACVTLTHRLETYRTQGTSWVDAVTAALDAGVCLSAEGWYVNKDSGLNSYATYGAAATEVEVDVLTGELEIRRVDILMDLGRSLNAGIDVGQLEGGFVMALGYFFTEQQLFDETGRQLNLGSWEYKIPSYCDIPQEFNVSFLNDVTNPNGILGSKASAEPPMSLAASAYFAVKSALHAARTQLGKGTAFFDLSIPCTVEEIRMACGLHDEDFRFP